MRILAVAAALCLLAGCGRGADSGPPAPPTASQAPAPAPVAPDDFLQRHWQRPIAPQGAAPARFGALEASLSPDACGSCHPQQLADWRTALHSKAMSPGLFGQLQRMGPEATDEHAACLECHAPLAEQAQQLVATLAAAPHVVHGRVDGASHADGLTCAGCHVRNHRRFGPPRRDGSSPPPGLPHGGWQANAAFEDSRFCATCHQFDSDGPSLNGKPLENTFEEWRASRHAREGRQCQTCHMPDRRHLWRGIHDADMVRSGLDITPSEPIAAGGSVRLGLAIANRNVGHAFPTYVTPRIYVEFAQENIRGKAITGSVERYLISRDVSLDLEVERADTRIQPDEVRNYEYRHRLAPDAATVRIRVVVEPDAFYADFYRAALHNAEYREGRQALRRALRRAGKSAYILFQWQHKLEH